MSSTNAPTTRETADHAELLRLAEEVEGAIYFGDIRGRAMDKFKRACTPSVILSLLSEIAALRGERGRFRMAVSKCNDEICQSLGKALGYPWFKDDQANFPGSTEADGVCVGDHVAESIADEAARRLTQAERQRDEEIAVHTRIAAEVIEARRQRDELRKALELAAKRFETLRDLTDHVPHRIACSTWAEEARQSNQGPDQ